MATATACSGAPRPPRRATLLAWLGGAALLLAGCAHYQLGTGGRLTFATLYVAPVQNHAGLPQAQATAAADLREAFARDGRLTLVAAAAEADAVLEVTLVRYQRQVAASNPNDTGLARKFALVLDARCTLTDRRANRVLFRDRPLRVTRDAFVDSGQLQSEYQAWPLLSSALAQSVAHSVLDVW